MGQKGFMQTTFIEKKWLADYFRKLVDVDSLSCLTNLTCSGLAGKEICMETYCVADVVGTEL